MSDKIIGVEEALYNALKNSGGLPDGWSKNSLMNYFHTNFKGPVGTGLNGPMGTPGTPGPPGPPGADGHDPYRIRFNDICYVFEWKGVEFIVPVEPDKYPSIEPKVLTEEDISFIGCIHPDLLERMVLFWERDYRMKKAKEAFMQ